MLRRVVSPHRSPDFSGQGLKLATICNDNVVKKNFMQAKEIF